MGLSVGVSLIWGIVFDGEYDELKPSYKLFSKTITFQECMEHSETIMFKECTEHTDEHNLEDIKIIEHNQIGLAFVEYLNHRISDIPKIKFYYNNDHIVLGIRVKELCKAKSGFNMIQTSEVNFDYILKHVNNYEDYLDDACDILETDRICGSLLVTTVAE